jgi:hypothetical protein
MTLKTDSSRPDFPKAGRRPFLFLLPYAVVPAAAFSLLLVYRAAPDFYHAYVLNGLDREAQAVETLTFFPALFAALILWKNAGRLLKIPAYRLSGLFLVFTGLAVFFFAGEEASWGQSYFFWKTPEFYDTTSLETNLHNSPLPVNSLANLFLAGLFVLFPCCFHSGKSWKLPGGLAAVVPEGPVIFSFVFAVLWKLPKNVMKAVYSRETLRDIRFYTGFVELINEHKEMLIALTFLMYAFYKDAVARRAAEEHAARQGKPPPVRGAA